MNFFETFPKVSLSSTVWKNTINKTGLRARNLRDTMMGQCYPVYACTCANHMRYSSGHITWCSSWKHTMVEKIPWDTYIITLILSVFITEF